MKKRINILFLAFATAVLLVLAVIPHHHHQGFWCNVAELCMADKDINDEHTHHSDDHTSCVEHLNFVATKYVVAKQQTQDSHDTHWFNATLATYSGLNELSAIVVTIEFNHSVSNKLLHTIGSNTLRAPPVA